MDYNLVIVLVFSTILKFSDSCRHVMHTAEQTV